MKAIPIKAVNAVQKRGIWEKRRMKEKAGE
jgi:hypothetical protein